MADAASRRLSVLLNHLTSSAEQQGLLVPFETKGQDKKKYVQVDRKRLKELLAREDALFTKEHQTSLKMFERAKGSMLNGVAMNWQVKWASPFPVFVKEGNGQYFYDVDGHKYLDFCLGDTGAMCGHAPSQSTPTIVDQFKKGATFMLPSEDVYHVGEELQRRFQMKYWQIAMTATDANRFVLRLCRSVTGRRTILCYNWCYHGTVDETFVTMAPNGKVTPRAGNLGFGVDPTMTTRVVEFNDLAALEKALSKRDVACILAEPAMTNIGIIHPDPGYWKKARELCTKYGTLLIIDETHTISAGPQGYAVLHDIKPDLFVIGKPIASGFPAAAYGFTDEVAKLINKKVDLETCDTSGIGGTLSGNVLALAAIRVTLEKVLTEEAYKRTIPLAEKFTKEVQKTIDDNKLPWSITRLGCRAEYWFCPERPRNGHQAATSSDAELDRYMHLYCLNRGILMTPFHNMALIAPTTTEADIDHHTKVFNQAVAELLGK